MTTTMAVTHVDNEDDDNDDFDNDDDDEDANDDDDDDKPVLWEEVWLGGCSFRDHNLKAIRLVISRLDI